MRTICLLGLTILALGSGPAQKTDQSDLEKYQGSWQATLIVNADGRPGTPEEIRNTHLLVEGSRFTLRTKDGEVKGTFTLNSSRSPKAIDVILDGQEPGSKLLGIYRIDGHERRSCFALPGKERPTEFDPRSPGYLQLGWKRKTP